MSYEPTIGLEIHVELKTWTKMFCDCLNDSSERQPNLNICPICTAQPGVLPVINEKAVESVLLTGLALNCEIPKYSKFDRKNYFYPDLPKGYQISQYDKPLCENGYLEIKSDWGGKEITRKIKIKRIHLEEDAGKLIHQTDSEGKDSASLVDFNRAGMPLMELVTEPDIKTAKEARAFAEELQLILKYLGVADAEMENGEMRVEVNISVLEQNEINKKQLGTKVEIKNLNSLRAVEDAVAYEIKRQGDLLDKNKKINHETRGWNEAGKCTFPQRSKEEAHDYRYFPEPDLPPLNLEKYDLEKLKISIPELPQEKRKRLSAQYLLTAHEADVLAENRFAAAFFEKSVSEIKALSSDNSDKMIKLCYNFLTTDLYATMKNNMVLAKEEIKLSPENFAKLINLFGTNQINSRIAKDVLLEMYKNNADPLRIIDEKELMQVNDDAQLQNYIQEVINENPQAVSDYKNGKLTSIQFLVGKAMAKTKGSANPEKLKELFKITLTE